VVTRLGGRYLLYFTARHRHSGRQCIGVAVGATAVGPFVSPATWPLVCQTDLGGSIDPQPFVDSDGRAFLLWKSEGNAIGQPSAVFAQRLSPDGLTLAGQPSALLTSGAAWEQHLIETPALIATGRSYMLVYSGGWWESASCAIGYATCDTPLGPCSRATSTGHCSPAPATRLARAAPAWSGVPAVTYGSLTTPGHLGPSAMTTAAPAASASLRWVGRATGRWSGADQTPSLTSTLNLTSRGALAAAVGSGADAGYGPAGT
jgi:hypothetical protein